MNLTKQEQELLDGIILDDVEVGSHHCEDLFNIPSNTTEIAVIEQRKTELVKCDQYDDKDTEIDEQYQEIYDAAMTAYDSLTTDTQQIEPKYRARNNEVAAIFLNTALSAIKEKAGHKHKKDQHTANVSKISKQSDQPASVTINMSDLIKQMAKEQGSVTKSLGAGQPPVIEEGELVEEEQPPSRKMKKPSQ